MRWRSGILNCEQRRFVVELRELCDDCLMTVSPSCNSSLYIMTNQQFRSMWRWYQLFGCTHWSLRISQPYLYAICVKTVSTNHFFLQFTTETVSLLVFDRLLNTITNTVNWSSSVFYMKNGDIRSRCKFNTFDFPSEFGRVFRKCLW